MWSDRDIMKQVVSPGPPRLIDPFDAGQVNPASYDLRLDSAIRIPVLWEGIRQAEPLDCLEIEPGYTTATEIGPDGYILEPGRFILASSVERVNLDLRTWARIEGKSSLGRIGLAVHITAGFIDPGFSGQVTLEMANLLGRPIRLRAGMRIAQIAFGFMNTTPIEGYGVHGHYQDQRGPVESRYRA